MTHAELWQLFPIILSEHNPVWKENYFIEKNRIIESIGMDNIVRINHFGSTSVPNLIAKPTIDILLEIKDDADVNRVTTAMKSIGFIDSPQPDNPAPHLMFLKGYTPEGFKGQVFHVHVRYGGDWDELYFRDYLIAHPDVANEYGKLKLGLKKKFEHDRDGYTAAKTEFIREMTKLAREEMGGKYILIDD